MDKPSSLERWDTAVAAYLSSRHALGREYRNEDWVLAHLRRFLVEAGSVDLDQPLFDRWRAQFYSMSASTRVIREHAVFRFCRYRRRREPHCFLPDRAALARLRPYALPTLVEPEQVAQLLKYVSQLPPTPCSPVRSAGLRMAIVLLYTAGLRRGEVVRLTLGDTDASAGVLRIRESKFHKSRWIPLSDSARGELRNYLAARQRAGFDDNSGAPLLCMRRAYCRTRAYTGEGLRDCLRKALIAADIHDSAGRIPRVQDFRHSFAVAALLRWYEADADVQTNLPKLALYMGHVSIVSTAYYLRWMPAVVSKASDRFARSCAHVLEGGAS